jgi:hypothetical protein
MSNSLRGMLAGLVATLVLSGILILKANMGLWPELSIIRLLTNLGSIQVVAAWMDHFIVGVVVWGLIYAALDSLWPNGAYWLKGLIIGVFAWFLMMVLFMPLAKVGYFGAKIPNAVMVTLGMHLIYGLVLGVSYGLLTGWLPEKAPEKPTVTPHS